MSDDRIIDGLRSFLRREVGGEVEIRDWRPLAGGASRAAYGFDLKDPEEAAGTQRLVLRLDLGGKIYDVALSRREEARVLSVALEAGVEVPRVLWICDEPEFLERDFLVMERVEGETIGRKIVSRADLADARELLPVQMGRALARIHAADASSLDFLPRPGLGESPARSALARARDELDRIDDPQPALELGWRWLDENAPDCEEPVLVHGDFRIGNVVVGGEGLRAVLDWEFTSIGDPHEDLAWPFVRDWRFGRGKRRFGGISDGGDFIDAYEKARGVAVDVTSLRYWEILGNFRWALGCLTQARRHLSGEERSIELASLGRRSSEMALEMFVLIEQAERGS